LDGFCIPEIGGVGKWELMAGKLCSSVFQFLLMHSLHFIMTLRSLTLCWK